MKKFIISIFSILLSSYCISQYEGENYTFPRISFVEGNIIIGDFQTKNCLIFENYPELNDMRYSKYDLKLTKEQDSLCKNRSYYLNPYCNLFNSKLSNYKYVIKEVEFYEDFNYPFSKGERKIMRLANDTGYIFTGDTIFRKEKSLISILRYGIENGNISLYDTIDKLYTLEYQSYLSKYVLNNIKEIKSLRIKELIYFDYFDYQYKTEIIGLGVKIKGKEIWMSYNECKPLLTQKYLFRFNINFHNLMWSDILERSLYKSEVIYESNTNSHDTYYHNSYQYNDINNGVHRNEFDAYWELKRIIELKNIADFDNSQFDYKERGIMNGEYKNFHKNLNSKSVVTFKNGIAHGKYISFYKNGKTKQIGTFNFGKKHGVWKSFYENGNLMCVRNYDLGILKGKQKVLYISGKAFMNYNYENGFLNGKFERYQENGQFLEKGYFKNGIVNGRWEVNYVLPKIFLELIQLYPDYNWKFPVEEIKNGILNYTIEIEQYDRGINIPSPTVRIKEDKD